MQLTGISDTGQFMALMNARIDTTRDVLSSVSGSTAYIPKMTKPHAVGVTNIIVVYYQCQANESTHIGTWWERSLERLCLQSANCG